MQKMWTVLALTILTLAWAQIGIADDKAAKTEEHDVEHAHVKGKGDHSHDDAHHKPHDHKAHHPDHGKKPVKEEAKKAN